MTPKKIEKIILEDGWYLMGKTGDHKHYKHREKPGKVTIPFKNKPKDLNPKTLSSIFKQALLDKKQYM